MNRMVTKDEIINILKENRQRLSADYGIKRIVLFGSFAVGEPSETSNIDIIVELERPIGFRFVEMAKFLEGLLGRKVDVLTPAGINGIRIPGIARNINESAIYV